MNKVGDFTTFVKGMDLTTVVVGTVISYSLAEFGKVLVYELMAPFRKKMEAKDRKFIFYGEEFNLGNIYTAAVTVVLNIFCAFFLFLVVRRIQPKPEVM